MKTGRTGKRRIAQQAFDRGQPDVVVGSSRGGGVALNVEIGNTPLVLIAPSWKKWASEVVLGAKAVILHSKRDDVLPIESSRELIARSGLPKDHLIVAGENHKMVDAEALEALMAAVERVGRT